MTRRFDGELTAEHVRQVLDFNQVTGVFTWKYGGFAGRTAGSVSKAIGYVLLSIGGRRYLAHRVAWLHVHGQWPTGEIDHINGVKADNSISNLRDRDTNMQNIRKPRAGSSTGVLGVTRCKKTGRYVAQIQKGGKHIYIGHYATTDEAHAAYVETKRTIHYGATV